MTALRSIVLALALIGTAPAFAVQPDEVLADPALEARARALSKDLRCMVCQNQSIDDSDAPLARDLRLLVRERLTAGDSDTKVIDFLTVRYGEFVLLKPRFNAGTALLWLAPLIALAIGGFGAFFAFRRRSGASESVEAAEPVLTPDERARITELLGRVEK
jgi:cytochrome c-type biogenesis protein CcmH